MRAIVLIDLNVCSHHQIERKTVTNWDDMEKIWCVAVLERRLPSPPKRDTASPLGPHHRHHVFYNELKVAPEEHTALLTYPADVPRSVKAKIIQVMYETFNVPSLYLGDQVSERHTDPLNVLDDLITPRMGGVCRRLWLSTPPARRQALWWTSGAQARSSLRSTKVTHKAVHPHKMRC